MMFYKIYIHLKTKIKISKTFAICYQPHEAYPSVAQGYDSGKAGDPMLGCYCQVPFTHSCFPLFGWGCLFDDYYTSFSSPSFSFPFSSSICF